MVVHHTQSERYAAQREPVRTWHESLPPATLAHKVAHEPKRKRAFRARAPRVAGYRLKGDTSSVLEDLRFRFLKALEEECESATHEWRELLPLVEEALHTRTVQYLDASGLLRERPARVIGGDAISARAALSQKVLAWADKYHLRADWLIDTALQSLEMAALYEWARPPSFRRRNTFYYMPGDNTPWTLELEPYTGDDPVEYLRRQREIFERSLQAHLDARIEALKRDSKAEALSFVDRRTKAALRAAALWQAEGAFDGSDPRTVHEVLHRLGLEPRDGLRR